jgi:hypothetical protein
VDHNGNAHDYSLDAAGGMDPKRRGRVTDENVAPNHGWRHRFSSLARHVDMYVDVQNIIQGHAGDKVASDYGDAWIETAYREIMKIPKYVFDR